MKLRAIALVGAVLPFTCLPTIAPANPIVAPGAPVQGPLVLVQDSVPAERVAARARFEAAREKLKDARTALLEAERDGGHRELARTALSKAEDEVIAARSALVEIIGADKPRTALEQIALEQELAARDEAPSPGAKSDEQAEVPEMGANRQQAAEDAEPLLAPEQQAEAADGDETGKRRGQVTGDQPEMKLGLTREERRQRREQRRAAEKGGEPQDETVEPTEPNEQEIAKGEEANDEAGRVPTAEEDRPSLAERLLGGRLSGGETDDRTSDDAVGEADTAVSPEATEPEQQAEAADGDETAKRRGQVIREQPEMKLGLTPEERRQRREQRRAAKQEREPQDEAAAATESNEREIAEGEETTDEAGRVPTAEEDRPSLAERLLGRRLGGGETDDRTSDDAVGEADTAVSPEATEPEQQAEAADGDETAKRRGQVTNEQPEMELGLTRQERQQRREQRRAAKQEREPQDEAAAATEPNEREIAEGEETTDEAAQEQTAEEDRPSLAERLLGRRLGAGEADDRTDDDAGQADTAVPPEATAPEQQAEAADEDETGKRRGQVTNEQPEMELGLTRQERQQRREQRRAAEKGGGQPEGQRQSETVPEVSAEELQQRRLERREVRQRTPQEQGEKYTLNQILQNQTTINQNQTTIDQSVNTNQTNVDQSITEQTVQQQQVIEQQRGPASDRREVEDRPSLFDSARRDRLARLDAQGRQRELRGELRATQRELDRTREDLRDARLQLGDEIIRREADRVIVRRGDQILVLRADNENRFGYVEDVERFANGYVRTVAVRGEIRIVTLYDPDGAIVRRSRVLPNGQEMVLIDVELTAPREGRGRPVDLPPIVLQAPRQEIVVETRRASSEEIEVALAAPPVVEPPRAFTLEEVRYNEQVRDLVPRVDLDTITFEFDSAQIPEDQLITLEEVGIALEDILFENPNEVFLIEGHTDAPGTDVYNLALSDRRAEAVAIALSQNFDVPPENLVTQGYGEEHLKVPTAARERLNRRVSVRRITALVNAAEAR